MTQQTLVPAALRCARLVKRYPAGVLAVDSLDLEVPAGECFGLLGPNGAGKTTTIEILEGLLEPTSGEVEVLGTRWGSDDRSLRARLGITLQETMLSEKLTVLETLTLFRSFHPRGRDPEEVLGMVGLEEKARARVGRLSGGQKQRLAVACALAGDPEVLFLDEPTTGLDPQSRRQLWEIIRQFKSEGRTILLTTHYMEEAERLCDRVAVIDHGRVIALGTPPDLIASLGGDHVIEVTFENGGGGAQPAATGPPVPVADELHTLPGVNSVRREDSGLFLTVKEPHVTLPPFLSLLEDRGVRLANLRIRHASLEDVFVNLTGRHLREEEAKA